MDIIRYFHERELHLVAENHTRKVNVDTCQAFGWNFICAMIFSQLGVCIIIYNTQSIHFELLEFPLEMNRSRFVSCIINVN